MQNDAAFIKVIFFLFHCARGVLLNRTEQQVHIKNQWEWEAAVEHSALKLKCIISFFFSFISISSTKSTWLFFSSSFLSFIRRERTRAQCLCRRRAEPAALSFVHLHFALTHTRLQHYINCIYGKFFEACAHRICARRCTSPIVSSSPLCCSRQRDKTHLVHFDWRVTVFLRAQSGRCHCCGRRRTSESLLAAWNEAARTQTFPLK